MACWEIIAPKLQDVTDLLTVWAPWLYNLNRVALAIVVVVIVVVAAVGVAFYTSTNTGKPTTSSPTISTSSTSGSSSTVSSGQSSYYFLIFTQKGVTELASSTGSLLGYERLYNISDSVPAQDFYWDEYPVQGISGSTLLVPINNGTVNVLNITSMKVVNTINVGTAMGFIGVAVNPNQTLAAIADGPSGIIKVINLNTLQVVFQQTYTIPGSNATTYPCDVRWTPDGNSLAVPMKNNNTVVTLNAANGAITADEVFPKGTQPYMLSLNSAGTMVATELAGNKTDVFLSLPSLKPVGDTILNTTNFTPQRGIFTPDGKYYLEASGSSNVIDVISLSNYKVVNSITLTASSSPGLADMAITPDSNYVYVIQHGTPKTGGIIYLIPLSNIGSSGASPSVSIPLTTAPSIALPISIKSGNYLANNVLSPPVTGLHC